MPDVRPVEIAAQLTLPLSPGFSFLLPTSLPHLASRPTFLFLRTEFLNYELGPLTPHPRIKIT